MADERDENSQQALMRARLAAVFKGRSPVVWTVLGAIVTCALLAELWGQLTPEAGRDGVLLAGGLMPERVQDGEWWRLFSGPLLHRGPSHLALNAIGIVLIGRPVEAAFGSLRMWWIWAGATLLGALGTMSAGHMLSVGASASVFGLIGALVAIGLRLWPRLSPALRMSMVLLPICIAVLIVAMGLVADEMAGFHRIDLHAHLAGGLGGLLLGLVFRMRLRDRDGSAWMTRRGAWALWRRRALRLGAATLMILFAVSAATAATRIGAPLSIEAPVTTILVWQKLQIPIPSQWRSGVWRGGRCQGALSDGAQVLEARRVLCYQLPLGGTLLIGRRDQLLTMDRGDSEAMSQADATGAMVRRQPGVLLYPIGKAHLYLVLGADALLPTWRKALAGMVPAAGSASLVQGGHAQIRASPPPRQR